MMTLQPPCAALRVAKPQLQRFVHRSMRPQNGGNYVAAGPYAPKMKKTGTKGLPWQGLGTRKKGRNTVISVTIIEDDVELKDLWADFIDSHRGLVCVSSYTSCEEAIKHVKKDKPNVILMDITLAGKMSGIDGVREIKAVLPDTEILMVTVNEEDDAVFNSLSAGASGYLVKNVSPEHLLAAIQEIHHGGAPMRMDIARKVVQNLRKTDDMKRLSGRERQVLDLLCQGKSQKQVADALGISRETVKFHIKNIYKKLHAGNVAQATFIAGQARSRE